MRLLPAILLTACAQGPVDTDAPWVDPCPVLEMSPAEVVLEGAGPGEEAEARLEITNGCDGEAWLVVDAAVEGDPSLFLRDASITAPPGQTRALQVYFAPEGEGERQAELVLYPHGLGEVRVPLVGRPWYDPADQDRDGHDNPEHGGDDCDDSDPEVYPGAPEQDNGVDDDCDGLVDEDFARTDDVAVVEVMVDPEAASDFFGEYVEILNRSGRTWDLYGWELGNGAGQSVPLVGLLEPGQRILLAAHADPSMNGGLDPDIVYSTDVFSLDNDVGDVHLAVEGRVVSQVTWDSEAWGDEWQVGASLSRDPVRDGWCFSTSALPGGDLGTPGEVNDLCDALSDRDGDGWTPADGDCDDDDASVNPGMPEVWGTWKDDDCDGQGDLAGIDDISRGDVEGAEDTEAGKTYDDQLGWHDQLGVADVDGDGAPDLLVGGWNAAAKRGRVWLLDGGGFETWRGDIAGEAAAVLEGEGFPAYEVGESTYGVGPNHLGAVDRRPGDVTGDGIADLVVAGNGDHWLQYDPTRDHPALVVLEGGRDLAGELSAHDGVLRMVLNDSGSRNQVLSSADFTGDGVAEITYGEGFTLWADGTGTVLASYGQISILEGATHTGIVEVEDADTQWLGDLNGGRLGATLAGADLDGDGYDDLVAGAPDTDKRAADAGTVYLLDGADVMDGGSPEDAARAVIRGASRYDHLGDRPSPRLGDLDGDGTLDLVLQSWRHERVWVFWDAGSLSGTTHAGFADVTLENHLHPQYFGVGLAVGDLDGDGRDDLAVGAAGDDSVPTTWAVTQGRIYAWRALDDVTLEPDSAHLTLVGADTEDGFGMGLLAADLDGDGVDELVVDAPGALGGWGRVYAVSLD